MFLKEVLKNESGLHNIGNPNYFFDKMNFRIIVRYLFMRNNLKYLIPLMFIKVEAIVKETQSKVEALIGDAKSKVDSGVIVAKDCSQILKNIIQNVDTVSNLAQEISLASREQSAGVDEINKAMSQLDVTTQQNSSASQEAANAAESLSQQTIILKSSVGLLMKTVHGDSADLEQHALILQI